MALPKQSTLHDKILNTMNQVLASPKIIFELDSTVLTLYGKKELSRKEYNAHPHKFGSLLNHPYLCINIDLSRKTFITENL